MFNEIQTWTWFAVIICACIGLGAFIFSVQECGLVKTLFLGNGSFYAAVTGMCN